MHKMIIHIVILRCSSGCTNIVRNNSEIAENRRVCKKILDKIRSVW